MWPSTGGPWDESEIAFHELEGTNVLTTLVVLYLMVTIAIGLIAARRVKSSADYMVAGRSLPLYMNLSLIHI